MDRRKFLRRGAAGTLAFAAVAPAAGAAVPAPVPVDDDLGFVQWAATAELVTVAFWDRALAEREFGARTRRWMGAMRAADAGHLARLSAVLADAAPTDRDFKVVLPRRRLASRASIAALGEELEEHMMRVLLGAVAQAVDPGTRLLLGQILVNDTQHLDSLRQIAGTPSAFAGLRGPLELEPAGDWLDRYLRVRSSSR